MAAETLQTRLPDIHAQVQKGIRRSVSSPSTLQYKFDTIFRPNKLTADVVKNNENMLAIGEEIASEMGLIPFEALVLAISFRSHLRIHRMQELNRQDITSKSQSFRRIIHSIDQTHDRQMDLLARILAESLPESLGVKPLDAKNWIDQINNSGAHLAFAFTHDTPPSFELIEQYVQQVKDARAALGIKPNFVDAISRTMMESQGLWIPLLAALPNSQTHSQ